ncbi:MAG: helical backbone metal receptor [bacterium]
MQRICLLTALLLTPSCGGEEAGTHPAGEVRTPRIAVMAPAGAEMLAAFDMLDHAVASGDFVGWPPRAARLPRIGPYDAPNLEVLLSLDVDLLVTSYSEAARGVHERIRSMGIRVAALSTETFEQTMEAFHRLGEELEREEAAEDLVAALRERIEEVRTGTRDLERRGTLVVVGRRPLYVAGPGSHLDELVRAGGGRNIITGGAPYQLVSMEAVLERLPEVIIDLADSRGPKEQPGRGDAWERWSFLPAVERGRVWRVHPERLSIPGPRLPSMADLVARMIHPDLLGPPGPEALGPLSSADTTDLEVLRAP